MATYSTLRSATKEYCGIADSNTAFNTKINRWLNDGQQDFANETNWKYLETRGSFATSTFQFKYSLASDCDVIKAVVFEHYYYPKPVNHDQWVRLNLSDQTGIPRNYIVLGGGTLALYPKIDHTAPNATLSSTITAATSSITLNSASKLKPKGRIIIDDEVIEYSHIKGNTLFACDRGVEATASASHTSGATCTLRNVEYDYFKILSDMSADGDVSGIPPRYHRALPQYATAQFFYSTEDTVQGDKFMGQYLTIREGAKRDLGEKQAQMWTSALDDTENDALLNLDNTQPSRGGING